MMKSWRDAATLILTARKPWTGPTASSPVVEHESVPDWGRIFDYKVLMLKRSSKSSFMPNAYVFPGGVLSKADVSKDWLSLFSEKGVSKDNLEELVLDKVDRPLLMTTQDADEAVRRDIAFRLTALRETFEESGVLLYTPRGGDASSQAYTFPDLDNLELIRKKVHKKPEEFVKLYQDLDILPDIWGLTEWSAWLTPTDLHEQGKRRFDTVFYLASLDTVPQTSIDKAEISAVQWTHPGTILYHFYRRELWLAPPQVYELSRLLNFKELQSLKEFNQERHKKGCPTWLPTRLQCDDGFLSILPGDSMYPSEPDYIGDPSKKEMTVFKGSVKDSEHEATGAGLNRLIFKDTYDCKPKVTCAPANGHVNPLEYHHFQIEKFMYPVEHDDCDHCPEEQQRFCHKQAKTEWHSDFNIKDLKGARNKEGHSSFENKYVNTYRNKKEKN